MQPTTHISPTNLTSLLQTHPPNTPIYMLNLLRYRPLATYPSNSPHASLPQVDGRTAYHTRYIPSIGPLMAAGNVSPVFFGKALPALCGPESERWDDAAIIQYPSAKAFEDLVGSKLYEKESLGHREASLEDWRLVPLDKIEL